jgi:hypothetical protein
MAGPFVFFDLPTSDVAVSRAFHAELAGLTVTDVPAGTGSVTMFTGGDGAPWGGFALWQETGQ